MPAKLDVLEERVANMLEQNREEHQAIMQQISKINEKLDKTFVTKNEFLPVKMIAYGIIGTVAMTVLAAILAQVVKAI